MDCIYANMSVYTSVHDELKRYDELSVSGEGDTISVSNTNQNEPLDVTVEKNGEKFVISGIDSLNDKVAYELNSEEEVIEWFRRRPWY